MSWLRLRCCYCRPCPELAKNGLAYTRCAISRWCPLGTNTPACDVMSHFRWRPMCLKAINGNIAPAAFQLMDVNRRGFGM